VEAVDGVSSRELDLHGDDNRRLAREWLQWLHQVQRRSPDTIKIYQRIIRQFFDWIGDRPLDGVTAREVERFLTRPRIQRAHGNAASAATVKRDYSCLKGMYDWLLRHHMVRTSPMEDVYTAPVRNRQPKPIADKLWLQLWDADLPRPSRLALGLGMFGGLRREEITRLQAHNVDLGGQRLVAFERKGGGDDTLALGEGLRVFERKLPHLRAEEFWPILEEVAEERSGGEWLIGYSDLGAPRLGGHSRDPGQYDPEYLNEHFERCARIVGAEHFTPHQLRHACASNLLRSGVPLPLVSDYLNHSNVTTTMRYLKSSGSALTEWLDGPQGWGRT
jgi:integrase